MKNLRIGFTLAEVLLTLGIVGVVAAIAVPHVIFSVQQDRNGAVLGRTVEQLELGCQNIIQTANDNDDLSFSDRITDTGIDILSRVAQLGLQELSGEDADREDAEGSLYSFDKLPAEAYITANGGGNDLDSAIASVWIDTNGVGKPNREGRDRFHFNLTNSCHMVPEGDATIEVVEAGFKIKY